ncbi:MAG: PQQ-binding-like beta-propeller repeat protein [Candidatus Nealsonbacteria bacterium]|nr:PQQ-binding-like beta-propeller repeat protein [Candidatus Nealsonbacteria bacterium]
MIGRTTPMRSGAAMALVTLLCSALPAAEVNSSAGQQAREILNATGVQGGLVVELECGDGKLAAALGVDQRYLVHAMDMAVGNVRAAREHVRSRGLYGRVSIEQWTTGTLPYNDNQVNLLIARSAALVPNEEIMRVLCPDGVAYIHQSGKWTKRVKPRPGDIDEWTHFLYDASNNAVAKDRQVATPTHLQWQAEPKRTRDHDALASFSAMTSSAGRIFYILDEGPTSAVHHPAQWRLIARDAFNGKLLWKRAIESWTTHLRFFRTGPVQLPRRLVSLGDRVYAPLGIDAPVSALDAATGATRLVFEGSENTEEFICHDGVLICVVGDPHLADRFATKADNFWDFHSDEKPQIKKSIVAFDVDSGRQRWRIEGRNLTHLVPLSLTAGADKVFYLDNESLHGVDLKSGKPAWKAPLPTEGQFLMGYAPTVLHHQDAVVCLTVQKLAVFSAADGRKLWENRGYVGFASPGDMFVIDGLVWTFPNTRMIRLKPEDLPGGGEEFCGFDLHTGEVKRTFKKAEVWPGGHHHRCYRNKATERFIVCGSRGLEFIDMEGDDHTINWWVRGVCQYGVMPCNGLIYSPPHPCRCFHAIKFDGFHALSGRNSLDEIVPDTADRLLKGPAAKTIRQPSLVSADLRLPPAMTEKMIWSPPAVSIVADEWPTYRHDVSRSGHTTCEVPAELQEAWKTDIGGKLSAPVVARDRLLVSAVDRQTLYCLDARDGKRLWEFVAGGRVDSPPTIARGLAVFGCCDGHVYAVRVDNGQLVWRFRVAPVDRRIVVRDRLESVWPVHGSVLVQNGTVYCAAGHTSYLDGGIQLVGLDRLTGKLRHSATVATDGTSLAGALPDVLVSDGRRINMREVQFDLQLNRMKDLDLRSIVTTTGLLEDCWAHRLNWLLAPSAVGNDRIEAKGVGPTCPFGKLLAFNDTLACGVQTPYTFLKHDSSQWPSTHTGHLHQKYSRYQPEDFPVGTRIYAQANELPEPQPPADPADKKARNRRLPFHSTDNHKWTLDVPLQIRAMVLAGDRLFLAGWPDSVAIFESGTKKDARPTLQCRSVADGRKLSERSLGARPVFDGMAAAYGRLYVAQQDGTVVCLGGL